MYNFIVFNIYLHLFHDFEHTKSLLQSNFEFYSVRGIFQRLHRPAANNIQTLTTTITTRQTT